MGCYWPDRPEGAACEPDVALPCEPPELPSTLQDTRSKKFGITNHAEWSRFTSFVMIKLQLRWIVQYFTARFNAQRKGKALSSRTLDSAILYSTPFVLPVMHPLLLSGTCPLRLRAHDCLLHAEDTEKRLLEYVGFCKKYIPERDRDWSSITLIDLVSCPWRLAFYMSFQMKRGTGADTMYHTYQAISKAIIWALHRVGSC